VQRRIGREFMLPTFTSCVIEFQRSIQKTDIPLWTIFIHLRKKAQEEIGGQFIGNPAPTVGGLRLTEVRHQKKKSTKTHHIAQKTQITIIHLIGMSVPLMRLIASRYAGTQNS
jgi:hypothetical protein